MKTRIIIPVTALLFSCFAATAPALVSSDEINDKRILQERVRDMARELITGILDIQIDKLEVNGMKDRPLYAEIVSMRKNVDALVETEMREVVDMLSKARLAPEADREKAYAAVREKTRQIVVRLSIERQSMFRRVRVAQLSEQIQRLLTLQKSVLAQTRDLTADKTAKTLQAAQDQRDVQVMMAQLAATLREVDTWGGIDGATASDSIRILKAADIDKEVAKAISALDAASFSDAVSSQQLVLNTLRLVLEKIQVAQGVMANANDELLRELQRLINAQEDIRERTRVANLRDKSVEQWIQNQQELNQRMDRLSAPLDRMPEAASLLQQAKTSSLEAYSQLLAADKNKALAEQGKVLGNLAAIIKQLQDAAVAGVAMSADELAALVAELQRARDAVASLVTKHEAAQRGAPGEAKAPLEQIASELDKLAQNRKLTGVVQSRATAAREAATRAAADPAKPDSLDGSRGALDRVHHEIMSALAIAQRKYLAVKIGELNRAAEALERTAAVEILIGRRAVEAGQATGFTAVQAKTLELQQVEVSKIATKTAEAIQNTAPAASASVSTAKEPIQAAATQFAQSKQTPQTAQAAALQTDEAARRLTEAARLVRVEIIATAEQLAKLAGDQAKEIAGLITEVESLRTTLPKGAEIKMSALIASDRKFLEAQIADARAMGMNEVAESLEIVGSIDDADMYQADAEVLVEKASTSISPLTPEIANIEQKASDALSQAATKATGPLAEALKEAALAVGEVARQTVQGNTSGAEAARTNAVHAMVKARSIAKKKAKDAQAAAPSARAAATSSNAAPKLFAEAVRLAAPLVAIDPSKTPEQAREQLEAAGDDVMDEQAEQLTGAAPKMSTLAARTGPIAPDAGSQINSAAKTAKKSRKSTAGKPPQNSGQPPEAGGQPQRSAGQPQQTASTEEAVQSDLEEAVAALTAKLQDATHDEKLANEIKALTSDQQVARAEIAKNSTDLTKATLAAKDDAKKGGKTTDASKVGKNAKAEKGVDKMATTGKPSDKGAPIDQPAQTEANPTTPRSETDGERAHGRPADKAEPSNPLTAMKQAASKLKHSSTKFAMKNKQIGKAAEDVSKQDEIANNPLLAAMKSAADLSRLAKDELEEDLEMDTTEPPMKDMDISMGDADQTQDESAANDENSPEPDTDDTGSGGAGGKGNTSPGETKAPKSPKNPKPGGPDKGLGSDTGSGAPGSGSGGKGEGSGDPSTQSSKEASSGTPGSTPAPGSGNAMKSSSGMQAPKGRKPKGGPLPKPPADTGMTPGDPELTADMMAGSDSSSPTSSSGGEGSSEPGEDDLSSDDDSGSDDSASEDSSSGEDSVSSADSASEDSESGGKSASSAGESSSSKSSKSDAKGGGKPGGKVDAKKKNKAVGTVEAPKAGAAKYKVSATNSLHDATVKAEAYQGEAWFLKLPPDARAAILGNASRRAPRGYEELLNGYFGGD